MYDVAFYFDGLFVVFVGLDVVGCVWDLCIGKFIVVLCGYVK